MLTAISKQLSNWLVSKSVITENEEKLYAYAVFNFLYSLTPFLIICTGGVLLNVFPQSIIFCLVFLITRKFAGGFHFKTPRLCFVVSIIVELEFLFLAKSYTCSFIVFVCLIVSSFELCFFSPIISNNRPLSTDCIKFCNHMIKRLSFIYLSIVITLCFFGQSGLASFIAFSVIMTSVSQIPSLFFHRK